ncbi:MAG: zf-HC2 domain-containing protein [Lachnospiraceae bacterium]|nr:zf-HC2 domain-containing protein [Lachnospiraceae bacterium]
MECKRAMELMTQFINEQLDAEDVQAFLDHIDSCPECREELEVTYSLMTAMKQLDEDTDLSDNYIEELNQKIETCYLDELKRKRSCIRRRIVLGVVVVLLVLQSGITIKEARQEEDKRFFRMIAGVEEETEQEDEDRISLEQEEDREENSEPEDKE